MFAIEISHIDYRYINTFENSAIDMDITLKVICENGAIDLKPFLKILISYRYGQGFGIAWVTLPECQRTKSNQKLGLGGPLDLSWNIIEVMTSYKTRYILL